MQNYIDLVNNLHESNPVELDFIRTKLTGTESQDEVEHILDFMYSNKHKKLEGLSYKLILSKTKKWDIQLQKVSSKDNEIPGVDYEVFLDFEDGFKIVKLISEQCYKREGKLMSHCVGSYHGRDTIIYSLRDAKNNPHCTIEDGTQIKGKGNGSIDPKYVDYIVKFLEKTGMTVGENEMKNLGYYKLDSIDKNLTSDSLYNGYIYQNKLNTIKDKEGRRYNGFGLWNVKDIVTINDDCKFQLYDDIKNIVEYSNLVNSIIENIESGYSAQIGSSGNYAQIGSSGNYAQIGSSGNYAKISIEGKYSIASAIGINSIAKGTIGTWMVLAEYGKNSEGYWYPKNVKCGQIDGKILKENTFYTLKDGEFTITN